MEKRILKTHENIYRPVVNIHGFLMDHVPIFQDKPNGMICQCGSRKNKIFYSSNQFKKHLQTQKHQQWLEIMNLEKKLYKLENELYDRYNENYESKEELWYTEMFPDNSNMIPIREPTVP